MKEVGISFFTALFCSLLIFQKKQKDYIKQYING